MSSHEVITTGIVRASATGATRDGDRDKPDYEGFLSPAVLQAYGAYMHEHRRQSDGSMRDSDNWQKGMPAAWWIKSLLRHAFTAWSLHRGIPVPDERVGGQLRPVTMKHALMGVMFNAMGLLHQLLVEERQHALVKGQ